MPADSGDATGPSDTILNVDKSDLPWIIKPNRK